MKPHRTDGVSLSFGLIFMSIVVWWAVSRVVDLELPAVGWLVAGGLILFGVLGLLNAIRSGHRAEEQEPVQAAAELPTPGDLPPEVHADIVRELLADPSHRLTEAPVTAPPAYAGPAPQAPAPQPPGPPDGRRD
jgi:hypothetical protein